MSRRLRGEYPFSMDPKGRVSIPAEFRKVLPETLIIVPGPDGRINVFAEEDFDKWVDSLFAADGGYNPSNPKHERRMTFINGVNRSVQIDAAGRIGIPKEMRDRAGLEKDVVVTGNGDNACIWAADKWHEYIGDLEEDFDVNDIYYG